MKYENIFQPLKIGPLTAKNRIEVSPAEPFLCTRDGLVTDEFISFTASMAKGGAAIVTVGDSPVTQEYADANHYVVNLADPFVVHGLFKLTEAIHRYNAIASIELNLRIEKFPADMTVDEIKGIIQSFTDSAERCKKAGFDMIMLHGGHGHTIAQFYSPLMNKREDEYGCQTFENRCRFANELLDSVRAVIGPEMAIEWRMSGDELTDGGVNVDDAIKFAQAIQNKIDLVHISAGNMYSPQSMKYTIQATYLPRATNVRFAEKFKAALDIPVTSVGSFDLDLADDAIGSGKADMIAMIRQFVSDPDCVNKAKEGRGDEIRPCIRCCICTGDDPHGCPKPLRCTVNPLIGRNPIYHQMKPCESTKKVVIVGGGAGGMEAARRCAERGCHVVLFEKEPRLGGSLIPAGSNALKGDVRRYYNWSVRMTERIPGIDLRLGTEATKELIAAENPDAVILAVGSEPLVPRIPGIDGANVVLAKDVDMGAPVGENVVLIGAGLTGTETAVALAEAGHNVTVIDMLPIEVIDSRGTSSKSVTRVLRQRAEAAGVKYMTGLRAEKITEHTVQATRDDGRAVILGCNSVVLSMGVVPRAKVVEELRDVCSETFVIGDCKNKAGNITSAVRDAFYTVLNLK